MIAAAPACDRAMFAVRNPEDGSIVAELAVSGWDDIERALDRGARACKAPVAPAHVRAEILERVAARVAQEAEEHARLIAIEGIKTIREARKEVGRAVETLRLSAAAARRLGGGVQPFGQSAGNGGRTGFWTFRPGGLVVAMTPFNDPLNLVAHKLGPAFAVGAPVILKPHPQTPLSALRLADHFREAGADDDGIQIVLGGAEVGEALVRDRRPRIISFTGGRAAGESIAAAAGMKRLLMELGGVGIVAVAADAALDTAAAAIHSGAFWAAGQNCVHAQRIIADAAVADALTERLVERAGTIRLGPKLDEATDMGPLVDRSAASAILTRVDAARADGARLLCGGQASGTAMAPTWLDRIPAGHPMLTLETFGPVSTIERADGQADMMARLAAADDAINAAIFTTSIATMTAAYEAANAGAVIVNDSTDFRIDAMPFGGPGGAGLGREGIDDAIEAMSEKKLIVMQMA